MTLSIQILSFNTLSLGAAEDRAPEAGQGLFCGPARAALLAAQLRQAGATVAALQETRGDAGFSRVGGYLRYASGSERGQYGTEWWFLEGASLIDAADDGRCLKFEVNACCVVVADVRRLFVRVGKPGFHVLFIALHAPHRATEPHKLESWWQDTIQLAYKHRRQDPVIVAGDCNCAVGSIESNSVGTHASELEDMAGAFLHRLLRATECWIPATFEQCHFGPSATYVQKRNGHACRVDYIALPSRWRQTIASSWLCPEVNAGHATIDHTAVAVSCRADLAMPVQGSRVRDRQMLAACFLCWSARGPSIVDVIVYSTWFCRAILADAWYRQSMDTHCRALRKACRGDRAAYVNALADKLAVCPQAEIFNEVHRLLQHKRKRPFQAEPLPIIRQADGQVCDTAENARGRWRQHFGGLEAGREASVLDIAADAMQASQPHWPSPSSLADIPDAAYLHRVLASGKCRKAAGPDGIPAELGKILPAEVTDLLFPLLLKYVFRGAEAVGHKAGVAVFFWKGRGSQQECSSYRAILLLNAWAKALHQALRPKALAIYHSSAPQLQLGSRPGGNVVFGSHIVRTFQRWAHSVRKNSFVLFADITAAYYSTVRELIATAPGTQGGLPSERALANLHLSVDELQRLREHTADPTALQRAGADPWTEAVSHCVTHGTFFLIRGDHVAVSTDRGTRPGSSWADILFATVMQRVLERRSQLRSEVMHQSVPPKLPWDGVRTLLPCDGAPQAIEVEDVVWADDLATMRLCDQAATADTAMALETGCLVDAFREHGFSLTFGERKTAILASPSGPGSRRLKQRLFGARRDGGTLPVLLEGEGAARIPLVATYRHLGSMQSPGGSLRAEIAYRAGQAYAAFAEGRRKVYRCRQVTVRRKAYILHAAVLPKLLYGCGSWPPLTAGEYKSFAGCLWRLYRPLLGLGRDSEQDISFHACLAIVGLPSPANTLRRHRLLYLAQAFRSAPDALWALIRADRPYAEMLMDAARWLHARVGEQAGLPAPDDDWAAWAVILRQHTGRFKGFVKRAIAIEQARHVVIAALDGLHRGLSTETTAPGISFRLEQCTDACVPCKRAFPSRVSWSGHAARIHGYRSQAFLIGRGRLCTGCGKVYSTEGRLKRHLVAAHACRRRWGSFQPSDSVPATGHVQAPPMVVPGNYMATHPSCPSEDHCPSLLAELLGLPEPESDAWECVAEHIAPLEAIRHTVEMWATHPSAQRWAGSTADDLLLLLDPSVFCESVQPLPPRRECPADTLPLWGAVQPRAFVTSGDPAQFQIPSPPPVRLSVRQVGGITAPEASSYACWIEGACRVIAEALETSKQRPVVISCNGLRNALGPVASWLECSGFAVQASRIHSP
ncbi:unnamed protein product [Symbiodinium sp. CCMP2456]|nr:unnamed protein product [Symbiodinium sp. CCMP2456]